MPVALHPRAAPPGELQVWLGATVPPSGPGLEWRLDGVVTVPRILRPFAAGPGGAFTGLFSFPGVVPGSVHDVAVGTGTELATLKVRTLPAEVPMDPFETFNVLLVSCFHRDEDKTGDAGRVVEQLPVRPHLTLLMGHQVYLDLPTLADFKSDDPGWLAGIMAEILRLARSGRPALCLTGDVHYGQVVTATEDGTGARLHEVISSPSSLVTTGAAQQVATIALRPSL